MKKKLLLTSILSIVMCLSLITGATFALFTSESTVNVAVTSGKVKVEATIDEVQYKTLTKDWTDVATNAEIKFDNIGGSATISAGNVTLDKIVPGDGLKFTVNVINKSNVATKYRTVIKNADGSDTALFNALEISVAGSKFYGATATTWAPLGAGTDEGVEAVDYDIVIELPEEAEGENLMGKTCKFVISVEAIQGNASPVDDLPSKDVPVDDTTDKTTADTNVELEDKAAADVPTGVKLKDGADSLTMVVEEAQANIGNFTFANGTETKGFNVSIPEVAKDNTETITVKLFEALDKNLDPATVVFLHSGEGMIRVATEAEADAHNEFFYDATTGDVTIAVNNFSNFTAVIMSKEDVKVESAEGFVEQVKNPGFFKLDADLTVSETIVIPAGITVNLDLNGKTITGTMHKNVGAVIKNEGTLTIINGTISSTAKNGGSALVNKGSVTLEKVTLNGAPNADGSWPSYTFNNTGSATVNDSVITSFHGAVSSYNKGAVVTLNNSEINMKGIPGFTSHGIYTYSNGSVIVNGGLYANYATDQSASGASVINGAVTVNEGAFIGRIENYYGTPVIKGGTFDNNPTRFVESGKLVAKNVDKFEVVSGVAVNDQATLLDAIKNGKNAVLAKDITVDKQIEVRKDVTVYLNGKTLTSTYASGESFLTYSALTLTSGKVVVAKNLINAYADFTMSGVELSIAKLGTSMINTQGGCKNLVIEGCTFDVDAFKVNASAFISINAGTKVELTKTTFDIGLDVTYTSYFINRSAANVTMTDCTFNVVDTNGVAYNPVVKEDSAVANKYAWEAIA